MSSLEFYEFAPYEQISVCVYLNIVLALVAGRKKDLPRDPKLNDHIAQAKQLFECCNICLLSGCIIHK